MLKAFDRLRGTTKRMFDEPIAPLTLWHGENQTGKTARLIAAKYALLGRGCGLVAKTGSAIVETFGVPGAEEFYAELHGPSGSALFNIPFRDGKWANPADPEYVGEFRQQIRPIHKERMLPLTTFGSLIETGGDLTRRELIKRFGTFDTVPVPGGVAEDPEALALWKSVEEEARKGTKKSGVPSDPNEVLTVMIEIFVSRKRTLGSMVNESEKKTGSATTAAAVAGGEQLPLLKEQLVVAEQWESAAHFRQRKADLEKRHNDYLKRVEPYLLADERKEQRAADEARARDVFVQDVTKTHAAYENARTTLAQLRESNAMAIVLQQAAERMQTAYGTQVCACALCGNNTTAATVMARALPMIATVQEYLVQAEATVAAAKAATEAATARLNEYDRNKAAAEAEDHRARDALRQEAAEIQAAHTELGAAQLAINAPLSYSGPTADQIRGRIKQLEDAERGRLDYEREVAAAYRYRKEQSALSDLHTAATALMQQAAKQAIPTAQAAVDKYLIPGQRAIFDTEHSAWGILDPNGYVRGRDATSGMELDILVPALACAYAEGSPYRALILDDKDIAGLSFSRSLQFFARLTELVREGHLTQVLIAATRLDPILDAIRGYGWLVYQMDHDATTV